jgi:DNA-binding NarL/FixJ family response regulator
VTVPEEPRPHNPTRVLLVDDQPLLRTGFRMILESEADIAVVGEAGDGEKAVEEARVLQPDVVLMDIRMPRMDGVEATRTITGADRSSRIKVLILTTFDLDEYIVEGLRAGASGFLLKDVPPEDLVAAVRTIHRGDALLAPSITRRLIEEFASGPQPGAAPQSVEALTEREHDVLRLIAGGLTNAEIAKLLILAETTVKTHVTRVLSKLGLRDRVQAVVFAYESGLVRPRGRRL